MPKTTASGPSGRPSPTGRSDVAYIRPAPFVRPAAMKLRDKNILVISNEAWGDVWFSKHNYAYELSRNNRVIFVDPAGSWRPAHLLGSSPTLTRVSDTLSVLRYRNRLPIRNKLLYDLNDRAVARDIKRFLDQQGFAIDLFLTFDPIRLTNPAILAPRTAVFLCVDKYGFRFYGERELCDRVDAIITVSEVFTAIYEGIDKPKLTIAHSISSDEFVPAPSPDPLKDYGLYVGTIDDRLDHRRVEAMLERFRDVPFVFVGRMGLKDDDTARAIYLSGKHPNLHYRGVKHFKELRHYITGSRFCISPLDLRYPGNHISHHKTLQYLALGKPVFSCVFDDYIPVDHLMYMENDTEKALDQLDRFLRSGEPAGLAQERIAYARERDYDHAFARIEQFLETLN